MSTHEAGQTVFEAAQQVLAALSTDMLFRLDPTLWLTTDDLDSQQDLTMAAFVLCKAVIGDCLYYSGQDTSGYLADLGLRLARRIEGLPN